MNQKCKICFEKEVDSLLYPCGHLILCIECANQLKLYCPYCRTSIKEVVKVFT